jgi:maleylpyruvate isomerase
MRPADLIEASEEAHRRLVTAVAELEDQQVRGPSLLPGWTRGHVITHLARNADSHAWLFEGAGLGEVRHQYPSMEKRSEEIEAGAGRSARELAADLGLACARLEGAWRDLDDDRWDREGIVVSGSRTMAEIVFRRLREVEVHHVDLDIGYAPSAWPPAYVDGELRRRLVGLPGRADHRALVCWLLGRGEAPDLGPW